MNSTPEGTLQFRRQRDGISSVPRSLSPLDEAPPAALDFIWKVDSQRCEASTKLSLSPLPAMAERLPLFPRQRCGPASDLDSARTHPPQYAGRLRVVPRSSLSGRERGSEISLKGFVPVLLFSAARGNTCHALLDWLPLRGAFRLLHFQEGKVGRCDAQVKGWR